MDHYQYQFEDVSQFFKDRLDEATKASSSLIAKISANMKNI